MFSVRSSLSLAIYHILIIYICKFGWNQVKYARIRPFSLLFTISLQIFPGVFSAGRDQLLGRMGQKVSASIWQNTRTSQFASSGYWKLILDKYFDRGTSADFRN